MDNEANNKKIKIWLYNILYLLSLLVHFIAGLLAIYTFIMLIGAALGVEEFKRFVLMVILTIAAELGGRALTFLGELLIPPTKVK